MKMRQRFVLDNVADYYFHHKKEYWRLADFPYPMPPFDHLWVEYKMPRVIFSEEIGSTPLPPGVDAYFGAYIDKLQDNRWGVSGGVFCHKHGDSIVSTVPYVLQFELGPDDPGVDKVFLDTSKLKDDPRMKKNFDTIGEEAAATYVYDIHPILMAFSLLNCKNIEIVDVEIPGKLQKARKKRGKAPLHDFRLINVLPPNVHEQRVRRVQLEGHVHTEIGNYITIRRGNYAKYGPKYGNGLLFGKYEGLYWRPAVAAGVMEHRVHIKGSKERTEQNVKSQSV